MKTILDIQAVMCHWMSHFRWAWTQYAQLSVASEGQWFTTHIKKIGSPLVLCPVSGLIHMTSYMIYMLCVCMCVIKRVVALASTHPLDGRWFVSGTVCSYTCMHCARVRFTLEHRASACCITWLALCFRFIPSWVPVAGCKVDLSDLHHVWEHNDMYICQSSYLHTHSYTICVFIHVSVVSHAYLCVCVHFLFPRLSPSQPMPPLILLDLVGLDQKLLTEQKALAAWCLWRQSRRRLY